jgi:hypothetical protein
LFPADENAKSFEGLAGQRTFASKKTRVIGLSFTSGKPTSTDNRTVARKL